MNELPAAALRYARAGWPVFPCRAGAKVPLFPRAHPAGARCRGECGRPGHGVLDASTDLATVTGWWTRAPYANVAIACGTPGPDVVDIDVHGDIDGTIAFARLRDAGLLRGASAVVTTPSGGWHLYFAGSDQGNGSLHRHGIDFRSRGGYVLVPPSVVDGRPYTLADHSGAAGAAVDFAAVRGYLNPPREPRPSSSWSGGGNFDALVRHVAGQGQGNRNAALYWAACRAVEAGAPESVLRDLVGAAVSTGLSLYAANATVASARTRAAVPV